MRASRVENIYIMSLCRINTLLQNPKEKNLTRIQKASDRRERSRELGQTKTGRQRIRWIDMQIRRDWASVPLCLPGLPRRIPPPSCRCTLCCLQHTETRRHARAGRNEARSSKWTSDRRRFLEFCVGDASFTNRFSRIRESDFSWKTVSGGFRPLPWATARAEDENAPRSPQPCGRAPQWAGLRSPHREQPRNLIHGCVTFGPNAQLSTTARPRWETESSGAPGGQSGSLSLRCSRWAGPQPDS